MSRIVPHNNQTWTGVPTEFLGRRGTYGAVQSANPETNAFTGTSSDTYCDYNPATGGEGGPVFGFGTINIPENATINSVACSVKIRCTNSNGMTTATIQLYASEVAKGTAIDFANSTSTTLRTFSNTGSWTREEIDSICLFINSRRSSNRRIYFYGADLTITYSYNETQYEVNSSSQSSTITVSPASQYVTEGTSGIVTFNNISDITEACITDNNVNVTNNLVNTSGTTYTYTIPNINADHTISVLDVPAVYVTVVNNSTCVSSIEPVSGTVIKTGQGSSVSIKIHTNQIDQVDIFDDNVRNNTTTLMHIIENGSASFIPSSYSDGTFSTMSSMSYGYNGTSNTSNRANIQASTSEEQQVYYNFNTSSIPQNATILSVSCSVRIYVSNTYTTGGVQLYSGTTSKSAANTSWRSSRTSTVYNLTNIRSFTREELSNARLRIYGKSGGSGRSIYFYGADLNVTYEYEGDTYYLYISNPANVNKTIRIEDQTSVKMYIKQNSNWIQVTHIYKKVSGQWTEVQDPTTMFSSDKLYIKS